MSAKKKPRGASRNRQSKPRAATTSPRAKMTAEQAREAFLAQYSELVGPDEILEAGRRLGAIQRQRKVDLPKLVEATVISLSGTPGAQTSAFVNYLSLTGVSLAPSSFYDRFTPEFAQVMKGVAGRALEHVRQADPNGNAGRDLGALLEAFSDVRIADSTVLMLKKLAKGWAPSTSKVRPAGVKFHAVVSLNNDLPIADALTPQRTHDNKAFPEATMESGTLSVFDLGYIDVKRFIGAIDRGAHFLTRLKTSHNPEIVRVYIGQGSRREARGMRLDDAIDSGVLTHDRGVIDVDVRLVHKDQEAIARVVAVMNTDVDEFHWYITSVDRNLLDTFDIAEAYRLRWIIELIFKQLKSGTGLSSILAWREPAVTALIYGKITALCLSRLLEICAKSQDNKAALNRLAMVLVLGRSASLMLSYALLRDGVTIDELEKRILLIATTVARTRNQRRERTRRKREASIGRTSA
jgi:hypothetical protein